MLSQSQLTDLATIDLGRADIRNNTRLRLLGVYTNDSDCPAEAAELLSKAFAKRAYSAAVAASGLMLPGVTHMANGHRIYT